MRISLIEIFFLALAHQCSFPYSTFQINDNTRENNLFNNFLSMLDMGDVRDDLTEHFGVVGDRIVGSFRSQPSYLRYTESDYLINPHQPATQVITASRIKDRSSYGTYSTSRSSSSGYKPSTAIGHNQSNYRIAKIEENEPESPTRNQTSVSSTMTQSTASASSSSFGINVRGLENDPINYRNPNA